MPKPKSMSVSILRNVFHPSDFSPASEVAFAHALKAALIAKADLTILHVSSDQGANWMDFPGVRSTLERWGLLPKNSPRAAVLKLGINVKKIVAKHSNPVRSVLTYLNTHTTDLIVLATDQHAGRVRWLDKSVAEPVARKSRQMTLFIPKGVDGFVSAGDGSVSLKSILIPVASSPPAQPAIQAAARIVYRLNSPTGLFTILHVGEEEEMPTVGCPQLTGWQWKKTTRKGEVINVILQTAREISADLIVMSTDGRNGFLDALRGTHSERVLHGSPCPLLAVPTSGFVASALQAESD